MRSARLRILLVLGCIGAALAGGGLVMMTALGEAGTILVSTLEGKAGVHARAIKQDLEVALDLGVPLGDIRQVSEYLEEGAQEDPDVRFAAVTNLDLERIHYGGMGRRRLDPLLAAPALREAIDETPQALTSGVAGVLVDGFSLTATPLTAQDRTVGFVVVSVQDKQVFDLLVLDLMRLLPALFAIFLLLTELALSTASASFEAPMARLARLMDRVGHDTDLERSGRHDRSEIGIALLRFNGILHRLTDRAQRVLALADEVQRAVFDAAIAGQVAHRARDLRAGTVKTLLGKTVMRSDPRSSDIHLSLTLLCTAGAFGLVAAYVAAPGAPLIGTLAGLIGGTLLATLLRSPGWCLTLAGALQVGSAALWLLGPLSGWLQELIAAGLIGGIGAALVGGGLFERTSQAFSPLWLLMRFGFGTVAGILIAVTVILEHRLEVTPLIVLAAVALAVAAAARTTMVRARLFERSAGSG